MPLDITQAYQQIAAILTPNPMQQAVWDTIYQTQWGVGLLLKGPTGSGKTEAISVPILTQGLGQDNQNKRRLIMVYPTRSLVEDQIGRFRLMLAAKSAIVPQHPMSLVVDTGNVSKRYIWKAGQEISPSGNPKRHLYQGDIIITTLDKFLYRFFGFGEPNKSYIYPLRIHYTHRQTLICFDEAHAYDDIAFTNFDRLVKALYTKGIDVALMTATMPQAFEASFDYLDKIDFMQEAEQQVLMDFVRHHFTARIHPEKYLQYFSITVEAGDEDAYFCDETEPLDIPSPAIEKIISLTAEKYQGKSERRFIVTVERVKDAVKVYENLLFQCPGAEILLYHGRLTADRRRFVYSRVLALEKNDQSYILVSTSAIEVGCDLNAHILITQLCDPERLIQRAGRCNRKQEITGAEIIVVGDTIPHWLTNLTTEGITKYVEVLKQQTGQPLKVKPVIDCIQKQPNPDYRIEMMFDMLYEYVYEAKLENKRLHERALLFTRSWEPTLTLYTGEDNKGRLLNSVEVPMSRCVAKKDESVSIGWWLKKYTFNWQDRKPEWDYLGSWECAYAIDLMAVNDSLYKFDEITGYVELPKLFNYSYRSSYRRVLVREENGEKSQVWYLDRISSDVKPILDQTNLSKD